MYCSYCRTTNPDDGRYCSNCGRELAPAPGPGTSELDYAATELGYPAGAVLANRFKVIEELGRGGMGRVYLAEDLELRERVAVKVLLNILSRDAASVERLKKEALLAKKLGHQNIVRVHDYHTDGQAKFLVMEYVEGKTLLDRLAKEGGLSEREARRVGIEICKGLEHAHEKKVIHRDLKPGNILLGKDGSVKIADFGIARACRDSMSRLTGHMDSGTLLYMSPEQLLGESNELSDLYSLGVVLYEMLSGEQPFRTGDISLQIREKTPKNLDRISPDLSAIVMKCLAKKPEMRFASIRELREELDGTAERYRKEEGERKERATEEARVAGAPLPAVPGHKPSYGKAISWSGAAVAVLVMVAYLANRPNEHPVKPQSVAPASESVTPTLTNLTPPSTRTPGMVWRSPLDGCDMVWVLPGSFLMGSPASEAGRKDDEGQHAVHIQRGFWMDTTEVTNETYRKFVLANPEWQKGKIDRKYCDEDYLKDWNGNDYPSGKANHPVAYVSWHAAHAYSGWTGKRLPSEAEWEYACRAGTKTAYWWGENFDGSRANNNQRGTVAVGDARHKNPWGLFDMSGNVWEWTSSAYKEYPSRSDDGKEDPSRAALRSIRGGSWDFSSLRLRSARRFKISPEKCDYNLGFRCVQ